MYGFLNVNSFATYSQTLM